MSCTVDARPGFYCGRATRGFVEASGSRRKPWAGAIEREFVHWQPLERRKFRTEAAAEAWVAERLRALDEWEEDHPRRFVRPSGGTT